MANIADALRRIELGVAKVFAEAFFGQSEALDELGLGLEQGDRCWELARLVGDRIH